MSSTAHFKEKAYIWTPKKSTVVQCKALHMNVKKLKSVPGEITSFTAENAANFQYQLNSNVRDKFNTHMTRQLCRGRYYLQLKQKEQTSQGGDTVPPEVFVTNLILDIIYSFGTKLATSLVFMYELKVPLDQNIQQRPRDKCNKYAHFTTDIT